MFLTCILTRTRTRDTGLVAVGRTDPPAKVPKVHASDDAASSNVFIDGQDNDVESLSLPLVSVEDPTHDIPTAAICQPPPADHVLDANLAALRTALDQNSTEGCHRFARRLERMLKDSLLAAAWVKLPHDELVPLLRDWFQQLLRSPHGDRYHAVHDVLSLLLQNGGQSMLDKLHAANAVKCMVGLLPQALELFRRLDTLEDGKELMVIRQESGHLAEYRDYHPSPDWDDSDGPDPHDHHPVGSTWMRAKYLGSVFDILACLLTGCSSESKLEVWRTVRTKATTRCILDLLSLVRHDFAGGRPSIRWEWNEAQRSFCLDGRWASAVISALWSGLRLLLLRGPAADSLREAKVFSVANERDVETLLCALALFGREGGKQSLWVLQEKQTSKQPHAVACGLVTVLDSIVRRQPGAFTAEHLGLMSSVLNPIEVQKQQEIERKSLHPDVLHAVVQLLALRQLDSLWADASSRAEATASLHPLFWHSFTQQAPLSEQEAQALRILLNRLQHDVQLSPDLYARIVHAPAEAAALMSVVSQTPGPKATVILVPRTSAEPSTGKAV